MQNESDFDDFSVMIDPIKKKVSLLCPAPVIGFNNIDDEWDAEKIEYLLSNNHLLDQMGREARKLAEKEYSIDEVIKIHLKIYKSFNE